MAMNKEQRKILFSGRVQGVGFRMTAVHLGRDLALNGTVRNMPDGRVELMIEGTAAQIETLIERLREHFGAFVRTIEQTALEPAAFAAAGATSSGLRVTA